MADRRKDCARIRTHKKVEIVDGLVKVAVYPEDEEDKRRFVPFWSHFAANEVGSALNGKDQLNDIMGGSVGFDTVKPIKLLTELLSHFKKDILVLDFYAGSGTTLNAVMLMNAIDKGLRKCILVQSPESFCDYIDGSLVPKKGYEYLYSIGCKTIVDLTYERNNRIINGYINSEGVKVPGLKNNNLRYYKTAFVERETSLTAKRKLMAASTDLLCIKNDVYDEQQRFGTWTLKPHIARYFRSTTKQMLIIYKVEAIERIVAEIEAMPEGTSIMVYVFSTNNYAMDADFEDVSDKVTLCALPAAIYNAYLKVLPKRNIKTNPAIEEGGEA